MAKWSFSVHGVTRRIRCFVLAAEAGVGRRGWCSAFGRRHFLTLSIITSNIYTRLAACNCISITFWSGDLPSPLMAIFKSAECNTNDVYHRDTFINFINILRYSLLYFLNRATYDLSKRNLSKVQPHGLDNGFAQDRGKSL